MTESGSSIYHAFIRTRVDAEEARKNSLEQRGVAVITTSGTLASLLLGFVALVSELTDFALAGTALALVVAAAGGFSVAAFAAVMTNVPRGYLGPKVESLRGVVRNRWTDQPATAEQRIAATLVNMLERAKARNRFKARVLFAAMLVEGVAIVLLATAVVVVLV